MNVRKRTINPMLGKEKSSQNLAKNKSDLRSQTRQLFTKRNKKNKSEKVDLGASQSVETIETQLKQSIDQSVIDLPEESVLGVGFADDGSIGSKNNSISHSNLLKINSFTGQQLGQKSQIQHSYHSLSSLILNYQISAGNAQQQIHTFFHQIQKLQQKITDCQLSLKEKDLQIHSQSQQNLKLQTNISKLQLSTQQSSKLLAFQPQQNENEKEITSLKAKIQQLQESIQQLKSKPKEIIIYKDSNHQIRAKDHQQQKILELLSLIVQRRRIQDKLKSKNQQNQLNRSTSASVLESLRKIRQISAQMTDI